MKSSIIKNKILKTNIIKEAKDLHTNNKKHCRNKLKTQTSRKTSHLMQKKI